MLGFGALKGMSDSSKYNRDILKSGKKEPFSSDKFQTRKHETLVLKDKPCSQDLILLIRSKAQSDRKKEITRMIVILIISLLGATGFIYLVSVIGGLWAFLFSVVGFATLASLISLGRKDE